MPLLSVAIPFQMGFIAALTLAFPAIVDWVTQNVGLRESTNQLRVVTGFLEGVGILLLSLTDISSLVKLLIVSVISIGVVCIGFLVRRFSR